MNAKFLFAPLMASLVLSACGGSTDAPVSNLGSLSAGQSVTLASGQTIKVPPGTTIKDTSNNSMTVNGHANTVNTTAGAVVTAPATAKDVADNVVTAK